MNTAPKLRLLLMSASLALTLVGPAAAVAAARGGQVVLDARYHHDRYYPRRGAFVRVLPPGYWAYYYGGRPLFFQGGVWYAPSPGGFVVTLPPPGLVVSVPPPFSTTVWIGGRPYYYADDVYYQWSAGLNSYEVVAPPAGADQPDAPPTTPPPTGESFFIYPKNGQSQEQQSQDRYECHAWASEQTGFDPTKPGGGVAPDQNAAKQSQYRRAMMACLEARGYSVQ